MGKSNKPRPEAERFWEKVDRSGGPDACWPWTGAIDNTTGYGKFMGGSAADGTRRVVSAHAWAYESAHGPIPVRPDGRRQPVDHECHNEAAERGECAGGNSCLHRRCCNPGQLRSTTDHGNLHASPLTTATRTHCPAGHEYTAENTYFERDGSRKCRRCHRERESERRRRRLR